MQQIKWQKGTVKENGVNGLQVEDVLKQTIDHVKELNKKVPSFMDDEILNALKYALKCDKKRSENRIKRGVEGTHKE